jgi:hypothetical protein
MRLAIGGPTRDTVPAAFTVSSAHLFAYTRERGPWGRDVTMDFVASTYIHVGREWFLEASIKQGATHIFWLDTDMTLPRETIVLLAMHEAPIVALNYRVRQASGLFTAFRDGVRVPTLAHSTGLEAVEYVGMGAMLMRAEVVAGLGRPWFRHGLNGLGGDVGEDVMFCRGLGRAGYPIYIDHDLSKEVGHLGHHTYRTVESADPVALGAG